MTVQQSLFAHLLGAAFERLPEPVRKIHGISAALATAGLAEITTPRGFMPWLICKFAGLPKPGLNIPVTVSFHPDMRGRQHWKRRFGTRRYASTMRALGDAGAGILVERLGLFDLYFHLMPREDGLVWSVTGWALLGMALPSWSVPRITCFEGAAGERFLFDIDVAFPIVGQVIHYRGWLVPDSAKD
jgi:hypothetical protein